ncbi:hypothetical protein ACFSHQ_09970 [Gemmobacter lanyuensis]
MAAPVEDEPEQGFIVTDGHHSYAVTLIDVPDTGARLVMFVGICRPRAGICGSFVWRSTARTKGRGPPCRRGDLLYPDTRIATPKDHASFSTCGRATAS